MALDLEPVETKSGGLDLEPVDSKPSLDLQPVNEIAPTTPAEDKTFHPTFEEWQTQRRGEQDAFNKKMLGPDFVPPVSPPVTDEQKNLSNTLERIEYNTHINPIPILHDAAKAVAPDWKLFEGQVERVSEKHPNLGKGLAAIGTPVLAGQQLASNLTPDTLKKLWEFYAFTKLLGGVRGKAPGEVAPIPEVPPPGPPRPMVEPVGEVPTPTVDAVPPQRAPVPPVPEVPPVAPVVPGAPIAPELPLVREGPPQAPPGPIPPTPKPGPVPPEPGPSGTPASFGIESASPGLRRSVAAGAFEKTGLNLEPLETKIGEESLGSLTGQMKTLKNLPVMNQESKRVFQRVMELVEQGEISEKRLSDVAAKHGIDQVELASMVGEEFSRSGRVLNQLSQVRRALIETYKNNPEAMQILSQIPEPPPTVWQTIRDRFIRPVENWRRRLMVTQLATATRNAETQGATSVIQLLNDGLTGMVQTLRGKAPPKEAFADAMESLFAFGRSLKPNELKLSQQILKQFPTEAERLLGTPVGDVAMGDKIGNILNYANAAQEHFFRNLWFDARIMSALRKRGLQFGGRELPKELPKLSEQEVSDAVSHALEMTFAKTPAKGTFANGILNVYKEFPFMSSLFNAFPRFWANSVDYLMKYSPLSFARLLPPKLVGQLASKSPLEASRAASQAMIGTAMWGAGYAIRNSEAAGPKWYQIKLKDGRIIDARPFAPFSTYLFLGEMMKHAQGKPTQLDGQDVLQGLVSINRIAGTGLVAVDMLRSDSLEKSANLLQRFLGEWTGSWTIGARTVRDFLGDVLPGKLGENERTIRSRQENPLTGPTMSNIPFLSQRLPAQGSPLKSSPIVPDRGLGLRRQLLGVAPRELSPLEAETARLGVSYRDIVPKTGDPKVDRLILEKMGAFAEAQSPEILRAISPFPDDQQKEVVLKQILSRILGSAAKDVARENSDYAIERKRRGSQGLRRLLFEKALENRKAN